MPKAILIVRVSTESQNTDPQLLKLIEYAERSGFERENLKIIKTVESGLVSSDKGIGTNELKRTFELDKSYNTVFCTEISRISRRQSVLHSIREWLVENKIQLHIFKPELSLLDDKGKENKTSSLIISMLAQFAEHEVEEKKERQITGRKRYAIKGESLPGKVPFGYMKTVADSNGKSVYEKHPTNSNIVVDIFNWYVDGLPGSISQESSTKKIAIYCSQNGYPGYTHSKRNINKLLKEVSYTGKKEHKFDNGQTLIQVPYPVIVSIELFNRVQEKILKANSSIDKSVKTTILARKILCPLCLTYFVADYTNTHRGSYRCGARNKSSSCQNRQTIDINIIDSSIWSLIKSNPELSKFIVSQESRTFTDSLQNTERAILNLQITTKEIETDIVQKGELIRFYTIGSGREMAIKERNIIPELISDHERLSKKKSELNSHYSRLMIKQQKIKDLINDFTVLRGEISKLDKHKDLIKKYVNLIVESINIVFHKRELSVFVINFNKPSYLSYIQDVQSTSEVEFDDTYKITLVIEKKNPNKKKLFYRSGDCEVIGDIIKVYIRSGEIGFGEKTTEYLTSGISEFYKLDQLTLDEFTTALSNPLITNSLGFYQIPYSKLEFQT